MRSKSRVFCGADVSVGWGDGWELFEFISVGSIDWDKFEFLLLIFI